MTNPKSWLTDLVHPLDVGSLDWTADGTKKITRHNCRASLIAAYRSEQYGRVDRWTRRKLDGHAAGDQTFFYSTDAAKQIGLIGLDVDCHGLGDPADAMNFCRWLRDCHFHGMHFEPSTSGTGAHGFLVVDWGVTPRNKILSRLRELEAWLNEQAAVEGFDVEAVEICGTPTQTFWGPGRNELTDVRFGQLFKLPRDIDACESTTRIKLRDLPQSKRVSATRSRPRTADGARKQRGSIARKHITREAIESKLTVAQGIVDDFAPSTRCEKHLAITAEHVSTFLAIAEFFAAAPNSDGTNPTARMRALWQACYADGTARVQHNGAIVAAIRNCLADRGLIEMRDHRYTTGRDGRKGRAMKWDIDDDIVDAYRQILTGKFQIDRPKNESMELADYLASGPTNPEPEQREILWITAPTLSECLRPKWVPRLDSQPPPNPMAA